MNVEQTKLSFDVIVSWLPCLMADNPVSQESRTHAVASGVQNLLTCPLMLRHGFAYSWSSSTTHRQQAASSWIIQLSLFRYFRFPSKSQPNRCNHVEVLRGWCICSRNYCMSQIPANEEFCELLGKWVGQNCREQNFANKFRQIAQC